LAFSGVDIGAMVRPTSEASAMAARAAASPAGGFAPRRAHQDEAIRIVCLALILCTAVLALRIASVW